MLTSEVSRFHKKSTNAKAIVQKEKKKRERREEVKSSIFTGPEKYIYSQQQLTFLMKDILRQVVFLLIMNYHSAHSFRACFSHKHQR